MRKSQKGMREAQKKLEEELRDLAMRHDVYYSMSDDGRSYRMGQQQYERICHLITELPNGRGAEIFNAAMKARGYGPETMIGTKEAKL